MIRVEDHGPVRVITIDRPHARNAVDGPTAQMLFDAFVELDADETVAAGVLTGASGTFCAGADLKGVSDGRGNHVGGENESDMVGSLGPMGPTRLLLDTPVIAAVEGHAVAGGLELACWCDLRVMASDASFGVFCRRWGVPLIDGGTVRLPRIVGQGNALDLILTGREIGADESLRMGLANRVVEPGTALATAVELGTHLSKLPPLCMRSDRRSTHDQWSLDLGGALARERDLGMATIRSGETAAGATRFAEGAGRHGAPIT